MKISYLFFLIPSLVVADCSKWEYAELKRGHITVIENEEAKKSQTWTIWFNPSDSGTWVDEKFIAGNIKKELSTYFRSKHGKTDMHMLNLLGERRWEAYDYNENSKVVDKVNDKSETIEKWLTWQFKRCKQ